jgi:uncharacterized membrane-anchored protein YitT (DUF2179 family)
MIYKPLGGLLAGVFGVIVLLKYGSTLGFSIISDTILKFFIKDLDIEVPIHLSINIVSISSALPYHTITDSPPNFFVLFTSLLLEPSEAFFHTHFLPSDTI